jgi:kynurenine formamidase
VRHLVALVLATFLAAPAAAGEAGPTGIGDSRADTGGLPPGEAPWWPSRYGADDEIGSLNELTAQRVAAAVRLVRQGNVVSLGRVLDEEVPVFPGRYWRQSLDMTPHVENARRPDGAGGGWGRNAINWITEVQAGTFQVGSQLDSIGHIQLADRFYNGWRVRDIVAGRGLLRFGMESVPPIVGRGVVLDIAGAAGVEQLDAGYVVTVADIEAALARQRIGLGSGDVVLVHTGWGGLWGRDNARFLSGEPGPGMAAIAWLYDRRIAAVGTDTWSIGPVPGEDAERPFLVPQTMYVKLGLFGFENLATEELVRRGVSEFLFVSTHARTRGSTAALVAPTAIY